MSIRLTRCFFAEGFKDAANEPRLTNLETSFSSVTYGSLSQKTGADESPPQEAKWYLGLQTLDISSNGGTK